MRGYFNEVIHGELKMASYAPNWIYSLQKTENTNEYTVTGGRDPYTQSWFVNNDSNKVFIGDVMQSTDDGWFGTYVGSYQNGIVIDGGSEVRMLSSTTKYSTGMTFVANTGSFVTCFLAGTLIACPGGQRPVEELAGGDLILTASGEARKIRWIGRQTIVSLFADEVRAFPIRVAAGALEEGLPRRDLFVSPGHALLIDGLLVHAGALENGRSIRRVTDPGPSFEYFHIETEDHAVILAEGVPAETFMDNVPRSRFDNHAEFEARFGSSLPPMRELRMPRVKSARQLPRTIRDRLEARAGLLDPALDAAA